MKYWVYENIPTKMVTLHLPGCSECNFGKGKRGRGSKTPNGQWRSIETSGEGYMHARSVGKSFRRCQKCNP